MQRYREIHDFLHTLTGLTPSVDDEVTLKWFEMVQTELPLCALSAFVGPARLPPARLQHLLLHRIPWAARVAAAAPFVMNVYYEQHFDESIDDLRKELRLEQAPWNVQPQAL